MATLQFDVPDDREADVLAAVAKVLAAAPASAPAPLTTLDWRGRAAQVVDMMRPAERTLLFRIADARERRVPVSELSRDLGLPASPDIVRDFPALAAFCEAEGGVVPVATGGDDDHAWYWMDAVAGFAFRAALMPNRG